MSKSAIVFMFSGQGSQYYSMAKELFFSDAIFERTMKDLDHICLEENGCSVVDHIYSNSRNGGEAFSDTIYSHSAIYMVEISLAKTLIARGVKPNYVLGASMGNFAAATIAGCIAEEDAMRAVIKQGQYLKNCPPGTMYAILDDIEFYYDNKRLLEITELAGTNFNGHFVISMLSENEGEVKSLLKGRQYLKLPVSNAFHSRWIDDIAESYQKYLRDIEIYPAKIPMFCSMSNSIIASITDRYFWDVVRRPILFDELVSFIEQHKKFDYVDCGPSATLATFLKYAKPSSSKSVEHRIITPYNDELHQINKMINEFSSSIYLETERVSESA